MRKTIQNDVFKKKDWHHETAQSLLELFASHPRLGLTNVEAKSRQVVHGSNELVEAPSQSVWERLLTQFHQPLIWMLVVAAILSGILGEWVESATILLIVSLNGILGFFQEAKAESALSALKKMTAPQAKVIRGGIPEEIAAERLVPGDIIELEAGDSVPADVRLIEAFGLRVQESALTGESVSVSKEAIASLPVLTALPDRKNLLYSGTHVVLGKAVGLVVATGMQTELGKIAGLLRQEVREQTPLQRRLSEIGQALLLVSLAIVLVIFSLQLWRGEKLVEVLFFSISLAVAAVPEGLPAVVTVALALGLQRMAKRHAIIRRLPSVETLGSVTVICSDKTGTLTRNEMIATKVWAGKKYYEVTGQGYEPCGDFYRGNQKISAQSEPDLLAILTAGALCNHARLTPPNGDNGHWKVIGDPTEGALLVLAAKAGLAHQARQYLHEIPFDSQRKRMSVILNNGAGEPTMYVKGAVEAIVPHCQYHQLKNETVKLSDTDTREILEISSAWAARALRVLAIAHRSADNSPEKTPESNLVFLGLVALQDPPREEAKTAVATCQLAGIRPVVITGDHPKTALAVAKTLGIAKATEGVMEGKQLDEIADDELRSVVKEINVFARVSPEHKLRIVKSLKQQNEIVAMTGDGVNDAPAVKAADIGICMGMTGTEVTKQAADMVLTDDNFASIISAVEEGRAIFENIRKVIHYLLACNASEIILVLFAAILGWPIPLLAIQILWINLVTDGLPALALAWEKPEPEVMRQAPRSPIEPFFNRKSVVHFLLHGCVMAGVALWAFSIYYSGEGIDASHSGGTSEALQRARAVTFSVMTGIQLFYAFALRSHRHTLLGLGFLTNMPLLGAFLVSLFLQGVVTFFPPLRLVFMGANLDLSPDFPLILGLSLLPVSVVEFGKVIFSWRDKVLSQRKLPTDD